MARDEKDREVAAWLAKARLDLRAAEVDLAAEPPLPADAAFHCQQAAEKALKGLLAFRDRVFTKTHDIGALGFAVVETDPDLGVRIDAAAPLTEYAWLYRYPGDLTEPDGREVRDALRVARELVEAVERRAAPAL